MYSNVYQWKRIRKRVLLLGESKRFVARTEGISRDTLRKMLAYDFPPGYGGRNFASESAAAGKAVSERPRRNRKRSSSVKQRWMEWLYKLERGTATEPPLTPALEGLTDHLSRSPNDPRKKILTVLAHEMGFSIGAIAEHLGIARGTARAYLAVFMDGRKELLLGRKQRARKADDDSFKNALFALLHEPPASSGFNRTTWRMEDLRKTLRGRGFPACHSVIREAIKNAGFRWKSAKVVLTSNDPEYKEKLERVQTILSRLREDERFFSIDEFGPFAIKMKPGRVLAEPGFQPTVPQWQKSKGWLIATAALELSENQVTHFYSKAKNTAEMIRMANVLVDKYRDARTLYLSWDAASWHMSKELLAFVEDHNKQGAGIPKLELAPLPASAQFLNVIESVFSGMARAIIHNSDYPSVEAATEAIDRYFDERNRHYRDNPKRAGRKIWGLERTDSAFRPGNNCKDPAYR